MQAYEAMREVYDPCVGKWEVDGSFTQDVRGRSPEQAMQRWFQGQLPPCRRELRADGTIAYELDAPRRERYLFSEIL